MKVLVSCYACSPYQGSEPGMGWNFVRELAKEQELHVITEAARQKDIDRYLTEHPDELSNLHFYYIARTHTPRLNKIWPPSYYWFYRIWHKKAYALAQKLDAKVHFDVVHQLNMAGYREPGYLWKMAQPFIWGPIGGFNIVPWFMLPSMGFKGCLYYICYNLINMWQMRTHRRVRKAMKKASCLIAAAAFVQIAIKRLYQRDSILIPEVGYEGARDIDPVLREPNERLRICWSGLHIPRKSLQLLLESLALLRRDDIELHVIGAGERTKAWKKQAECLGLRHIIWHGWVSREEALQLMKSGHLFCITSMQDLSSTVLLEALSFGIPVIAPDHCGFSNVLRADCGRKIALINKAQFLRDYAAAIAELADNEPLRRELSAGAQKRAQEFSWEEKGREISRLYQSLVKEV